MTTHATESAQNFYTLDEAITSAFSVEVPPVIRRDLNRKLTEWYAQQLQIAKDNNIAPWVLNLHITKGVRQLAELHALGR